VVRLIALFFAGNQWLRLRYRSSAVHLPPEPITTPP